MSEPFVVEIDPDKHLVRLSCGQCGNTTDLSFELADGKLRISLHDSVVLGEDGPTNYLTPVEITV